MAIQIPQDLAPQEGMQIPYDPNEGNIRTGIDSFAVETGKLLNGAARSISTLLGSQDWSDFFGKNVNAYKDVQDRMEAAKPTATNIGKWGAIGDLALLTTPIVANKVLSVLGGYYGAASSQLADTGSDTEAPNRETLIHDLTHSDVALGLVGGLTGLAAQHFLGSAAASKILSVAAKKLAKPAALTASRVIEGTVEGVDPNLYMPSDTNNTSSSEDSNNGNE